MNSPHSINTSSGLFLRLCSGILRKNWAINTPSPPDLDLFVTLTVSRSVDLSVFTDAYAYLMPPHVCVGVCVSYSRMNLAHLSFLHASLHPEDVRVAPCVIHNNRSSTYYACIWAGISPSWHLWMSLLLTLSLCNTKWQCNVPIHKNIIPCFTSNKNDSVWLSSIYMLLVGF